MKTKIEFLEKYGLESYPSFTPMDDATWALRDIDDIPTEWALARKPLADKQWKLWEKNLHQVETKKLQSIFLEDLARGKDCWHLRLEEKEEEVILPILFPHLAPNQSLHLEITIPDHAAAKIIILEKARENEDPDFPEAEDEKFRNITINMNLADYSQLEVYYIHPISPQAKAFLSKNEMKLCLYHAEVGAGAKFNWTSINLEDSLVEKGEVHLQGEGAEANTGGASFGQNNVSQSYVSHIYAHKPHQRITIHNHGVVAPGGVGHFASIADIAKGAHSTKAREENRFMTLGEGAQAYADPTLLIDEHDVEASHAATVGQIDENQLFYLQSRGLNKVQASRLMTAAFLTPLFDRIQIDSLREELLEEFYHKIEVDAILMEDV